MNKEKFQRVLKYYLIVVNAVLLLSVLAVIGDGSGINWGTFIFIILLMDGIPLLIYLCAYIILWSKSTSKHKIAYSTVAITLFLSILLLSFIPVAINGDSGGNTSNDTKRCGSCHKSYERYDTWGNLDDDYSSIQRRGMCERCYENYKWTHGK